jgi:superfamily II RNA helicase
VDDNDRLTPDGLWASKLRLDQPLVIAEAIRKGGLDSVSPEVLAGGLAPFVWDRIQEVSLSVKGRLDVAELEDVFYRVLDYIEEIRNLKKRRGFENPQIMFWPAVALFLWAKGVSWEQLLETVSVNEGDLASLIIRTADHLRQVVNLKESHTELAFVAGKASELILREPVYID